MNIGIGFYNLWLLLATIGAFAWVIMAIGDKLRGVKIENPEDHHSIYRTVKYVCYSLDGARGGTFS